MLPTNRFIQPYFPVIWRNIYLNLTNDKHTETGRKYTVIIQENNLKLISGLTVARMAPLIWNINIPYALNSFRVPSSNRKVWSQLGFCSPPRIWWCISKDFGWCVVIRKHFGPELPSWKKNSVSTLHIVVN